MDDEARIVRTAHGLASRLHNLLPSVDADDLAQDARLALWLDPSRRPYTAMIDALRLYHDARRYPLQPTVELEDGHGALDSHLLGAVVAAETEAEVRAGLRHLQARPRHVLIARFWLERSQRAVGLDLGISESRVCQIERRALAELAVVLGSAGTVEHTGGHGH